MKRFFNLVTPLIILLLPLQMNAQSLNQTETVSTVLPESGLPFTLEIDVAPFSLPTGIQSYVSAVYRGKWIFLAGRTNGLHSFSPIGNNFPPNYQNTTVYVIDPISGESFSRSLTDPSSGLSQSEIDSLSVTAAEFFQKGSTLYFVGGYGINTATGQMETKSTLTTINLKKLIKWVKKGTPSVKKAIRQVSHPILQVTGGALFQDNDHEPFLLMLGQNFAGFYRGSSNGIYTQQIRAFWLNEEGKHLSILPKETATTFPDYRRRDLNVVPIMKHNKPAYVAFAGVFTIAGGVWTVPITILPDGSSFEPDPNAAETFKQAMNQYICPSFGLYSTRSKDMYVVFPGGLSYGFFSEGVFTTDENVPFINQVTTIKIDKHDHYTQYLMNSEYPVITVTGPITTKQLRFGASAQFFPAEDIPTFRNGVIQLDELGEHPIMLGYIVGGIMSKEANTVVPSQDSTASPYVFTVKLIPK